MENIIGQTIYAVTKTGNVKTWCAGVYGNPNGSEVTIEITTRTKLDGKKVIRHDIITKGKNIGKSNETTPYEQAMSEAGSKYNKKIDRGYGLEIPTDTSQADSNALGLPRPMLAHPIDKVKKVEFPAYFQPKLDGHRAVVTKRDGEMFIYSRQGKPITTMGHILEFLDDKIEEGQFLDGELYIHGMPLQKITSLIKKYRPESLKMKYHVYDIMMDEPYTQRLEKLHVILEMDYHCRDKDHDPVLLVFTHAVDSMDMAMTYCDASIKDGYEGGILRTPDKGYEAGFRSRTLLKIKTFDDTEFEIVDVIEGKDRIVNDVSLKVACFTCKTPEGKLFEVTSPGNMNEKDAIWHNREDYVGQLVTVKHSGYTKDMIPWHPVALRMREDI